MHFLLSTRIATGLFVMVALLGTPLAASAQKGPKVSEPAQTSGNVDQKTSQPKLKHPHKKHPHKHHKPDDKPRGPSMPPSHK
jgi:hypothetical protein